MGASTNYYPPLHVAGLEGVDIWKGFVVNPNSLSLLQVTSEVREKIFTHNRGGLKGLESCKK